jgi:hypothetical protein
MAATIFPAPSSESLPILASQKIFETFSADGFMSYRPTGGLPAGRYAVEARGVDVDYLDITAPGFAYQGKGNTAFFQVPAGGSEIQATACTYGDPGFLATARSFSLPTFAFVADVLGTYSWQPGSTVAHDGTNWVAMGGSAGSMRVAASANGASWTLFSGASGGWSHLGDTTSRGIIADVAYMKGALYATSYAPDGGGIYRTFDLTGRSGWSMVYSSGGGFNLFASPNPSSNRVFRTEQGLVRYSDNNGASWTQVTVGSGLDTGNGIYSPVTKGNDIYVISSGRYYSGGQTSKIFKSTNDGASWTEVFNFGTDLIPIGLAYSPTLNRFAVTVAQSASSNGMRVQYSDNDCVTWTYGGGFPGNPNDTSGNYLNHAIIWHNDRFVAAFTDGSNGPVRLGWSSDAVSTFSNFIDPAGTIVSSLISTSSGVLYRTTNSEQGVGRTTNFSTFTQPTSNFSSPNGIAYANGNYMVTNGSSSYLWGPTLDNLELKTNAPVPLSQVVAGNGVFLARNPNTAGFAITSDSITWTQGLGGASNTHQNIPSFTGGFFFRIDSSRNLHTSIDGVTWTYRAQLPTVVDRFTKVKDIYIGYGRLLTGGTTTVNYISRDLTNWDTTTSGTNYNLWSIAYSETEKVYVGQVNNSTNLLASSSIDFNGGSSTGGFATGLSLGRTTNSVQIATSNVGRVENIAGLVIGKYGHVVSDGSGSTTDLTGYRMFYAWPNSITQVLIPDTTNNEQISRANGELTVINGSTATIRVKYGKPAVFAVYRLKD